MYEEPLASSDNPSSSSGNTKTAPFSENVIPRDVLGKARIKRHTGQIEEIVRSFKISDHFYEAHQTAASDLKGKDRIARDVLDMKENLKFLKFGSSVPGGDRGKQS